MSERACAPPFITVLCGPHEWPSRRSEPKEESAEERESSQCAWLTRWLPLCHALSSAQEVTAPTERTSPPPGSDHYPRPLSFQMKGQYWLSVVTSPGEMHHSGHFPTECPEITFERIPLLNSLKLANLGVLCQSPDSDSLTPTVKANIWKSASNGRGVCPSLTGHPAGEADIPPVSWSKAKRM